MLLQEVDRVPFAFLTRWLQPREACTQCRAALTSDQITSRRRYCSDECHDEWVENHSL